jgi:hypothetical protein
MQVKDGYCGRLDDANLRDEFRVIAASKGGNRS